MAVYSAQTKSDHQKINRKIIEKETYRISFSQEHTTPASKSCKETSLVVGSEDK